MTSSLNVLLRRRELGTLSLPSSFSTSVHTCRLLSHFSSTRSYTSSTSSPVSVLDLETFESRFLLSGTVDGRLCLVDSHEGSKDSFSESSFIKAHNSRIQRVEWYPKENGLFTSSSRDGFLKVWDPNYFCDSPLETIRVSDVINTHEMSPLKPQILAVSISSNHFRILDLKTGAKIHSIGQRNQDIISLVFWHPIHENLIGSGGINGKLALWDIRASQRPLCTSNLPIKAPLNDFQWNEFGDLGVSVDAKGSLDSWNFNSSSLCLESKLSFSRLSSPTPNIRIGFSFSKGLTSDFLFLPENNGTVRVCNVNENKEHFILNSHFGSVNVTCFDDGVLWSGGDDGAIIEYSSTNSLSTSLSEDLDSSSDEN